MFAKEELTLMVLVARLYHENSLTQEDIANRMNLSRQKISRLLIAARKAGIVKTIVLDPNPGDTFLAEELMSRFSLQDVVLTSGEYLDSTHLREGIGLAAAEYLQKCLKDDQLVGIGWGRTLFETVNLLRSDRKNFIDVIPLIGGLGDISPFFQVNELTRRLSDAFAGTYRNLYVPAFIEDSNVRENLLQSQEVRQVVDLWTKLDVAIVGVGHVEFQQVSSMFFVNHITPKKLTLLQEMGTVGDICGRFFNAQGKEVNPEMGVVGIGLETLKNIPNVIAVAGGMEKVSALLGALRGGYVKILITDTISAQALLIEDKKGG
jgi:DNA-binding transcriptional regulator LsrR (DeoR family)